MPRPKKNPQTGTTERKKEQTSAPAQELTAAYFDVYNAARLAHCTIHLHETHIAITQNGDETNYATFARTEQGYGEAIRWIANLAPHIAETIRAVTEGALFFMLNSLALPIDIQLQETGLYAWEVIGKRGEALSFLDALRQALTAFIQEHQQEGVTTHERTARDGTYKDS